MSPSMVVVAILNFCFPNPFRVLTREQFGERKAGILVPMLTNMAVATILDFSFSILLQVTNLHRSEVYVIESKIAPDTLKYHYICVRCCRMGSFLISGILLKKY